MHEPISPIRLLQSSSGSSQTLIMSTYRTLIANQLRLVTITWCKNHLLHGLSVSVDGPSGHDHHDCKLELKPWYVWRKQGSKQFEINGHIIGIFWDLRAVKFNGEVEPQSDYYVAIVSEDEVVLVVGDLKKDAFRRTKCRPALECNCTKNQCTIEIAIDGELVIEVKHLQWKFRGNEKIIVKEAKIDKYWDVHDWLFGSGPRHGMFLFKPSSSSSLTSSIHADYPVYGVGKDGMCDEVSELCLFIYAWKVV